VPPGRFGIHFHNFMKRLNMHVAQLPLPTCMPVWLKCDNDQNYIILSGSPSMENKGEVTYIRILDVHDFI